jgi:uncharacterized CHY-type Zn-finger protein
MVFAFWKPDFSLFFVWGEGMLKYYLSRYMNLEKCDEIQKGDLCKKCGGDLEGRHFTDFPKQLVKEVRVCYRCKKLPKISEYTLH